MIIATHSGKFHADDVWAVTVLDLVFPGCTLVRTRDAEQIRAAERQMAAQAEQVHGCFLSSSPAECGSCGSNAPPAGH